MASNGRDRKPNNQDKSHAAPPMKRSSSARDRRQRNVVQPGLTRPEPPISNNQRQDHQSSVAPPQRLQRRFGSDTNINEQKKPRGPERPPPERKVLDIRLVLCNWSIKLDDYGRCFQEHYSNYRWLLSRLLSENLQEPSALFGSLPEDTQKKLHKIISKIESYIYQLNRVVKVVDTIERDDQSSVVINWLPKPASDTLLNDIKRACTIPSGSLGLDGMSLTIKPGNRRALSSDIDNCLRELEVILSPFRMPTDMVGWCLNPPSNPKYLPERTESISSRIEDEEFRLGIYEMNTVDPQCVEPNGEWRGIAKLFLHFIQDNGSRHWFHGTGWLVDNYTIATNGHNVYNWSRKPDGTAVYNPKQYTLMRLTSIEVIFGLERDPSAHYGTYVVVHSNWYRDPAAAASLRYDLAFIRLDTAPSGVTPLEYSITPCYSHLRTATCVGYPAESKNGLEMHIASGKLRYDVNNAGGMIEHILDTECGNSGGPVLCDRYVIGVHRGSGVPLAKCFDKNGKVHVVKRVNKAVIIDNGANNPEGFRLVLEYLATHRLDKGVTVMLRSDVVRQGDDGFCGYQVQYPTVN
ncbi:hypothetical protein TWF696_005994 [Orbilia brochopaga]|uniref:Serine protease n=1 Tax=Orbilia brochopaga TaxID=3140254 RepID=A0AAV9UUZ1_9PEZI